MKLYELSAQVGAISDYLSQEECPIDEASLRQKLSELNVQFNDKVEGIAKIILSNESDTVAIKAEVDRLSIRKSSKEKQTEWLKSYVIDEMKVAGKTELPLPLFKVAVQTNPMSINILDANLVPVQFRKEIPATFTIDKKSVADSVKATGEIPAGVEVVTTKKSLRIK
jgi:hypothetical protein